MSTVTEPQIGLIRTLFAERDIPNAIAFLDEVENTIDNGTLTKEFAQNVLIPSLKAMPYTPAAVADMVGTGAAV